MAGAQSTAISMTVGSLRVEAACGLHRPRGGCLFVESSSSASSAHCTSASSGYCTGGCSADGLAGVSAASGTDGAVLRGRRRAERHGRAVGSPSLDSPNGNISYNVPVLGPSSVGLRCLKPPSLAAAAQGLYVRHVDLEHWLNLEEHENFFGHGNLHLPWRANRPWEGRGEKSRSRVHSSLQSLRAAGSDGHGYSRKGAGSNIRESGDGAGGGGRGGEWWEGGGATSAPSRLSLSPPSYTTSSSSPISHWDLLRNDVQYLDWRARQDVNAIKEAHDRVVEVLNPIAREMKSISTLRDQLTELQSELSKAHEQVHMSEARVEHTMQRLLAMEALMNESYARVLKSSTKERGAGQIAEVNYGEEKRGDDEAAEKEGEEEEEEEEEGEERRRSKLRSSSARAAAAIEESRRMSTVGGEKVGFTGSVSPSPSSLLPAGTVHPSSPSSPSSSALAGPDASSALRLENMVDNVQSAPSSSSSSTAVAAVPRLRKKGLDVSGPPKQYAALRNFWYPVAFSDAVDKTTLAPFDCFEEPWVLFRNAEGRIGCVRDECAHRACPLSLGTVVDGRVQCPYHGWEYTTSGTCEKMPSTTPSRVSIRSLPCVEQDGMIWVWPGTDTPARQISSLTPPSGYTVHAQIVVDVPVEHGLLVENLLDLAHAPFTHTTTFAKGWAIPSVVQFETMAASALRGHWDPYPIDMEFRPPCMVLSTIGLSQPGKLEGKNAHDCDKHLHQLHVCVPSSRGKTRLLYRMSLDFAKWAKYVPYVDRLWQHMANQVLAEDMRLVEGQQDRMKRGANVWNYPVPYDKLGVRYRRWRISVEDGDNLPHG